MIDTPIRILLVDDHAMVRRGLATFLKVYDDLQLVGEAATGEMAIQFCATLLPDVILMDLVMPDMDGVTTTRLIREKHPTVQIIALTSFKEEKLVQGALNAGAVGYLLKDVSAEVLARAIRDAHAGRTTISPEAFQVLIHATNRPPTLGHDLTEREHDVLSLLVEDLNNNEIAARLGVSPSTIKSHVSHILTKLNVDGRTGAVAFAIRNGLVS
ncbi:MAG TPA: response regulator transcription factor [Anaerolineae bacterium]|nr:response regulator transcription factor [Anaerolineae bacterium]